METSRRGFLRALLGGAAVVVAAPIIKPKSFFSFFGIGEIWTPKPVLLPEYYPTLADIVRKMPPSGSYAKIAELLNEKNSILDDIPWLEEPSMDLEYKTTRVSLPDVAAQFGSPGSSLLVT